jgi:hypothetical protein
VTEQPPQIDKSKDFARQAKTSQRGLLREYWAFLRRERNWWLTPILLLLLAAAAFVVVAGTAAAPLIYALF